MLNYEDAKALVFEHIKPLEKVMCPLEESQGRALSEDILAPHGIPLFDNSAVDGYAVKAADLVNATKENPIILKKLGYISAGDPGKKQIMSGECVQIATGAPLPIEADSIVRMEDVKIENSQVCFFNAISKAENVQLGLLLRWVALDLDWDTIPNEVLVNPEALTKLIGRYKEQS